MPMLLQVVNFFFRKLQLKKLVDGCFSKPFDLKFNMYNTVSVNFKCIESFKGNGGKRLGNCYIFPRNSLPFCYLLTADNFLNFLFCLFSIYLHTAAKTFVRMFHVCIMT